MDQRAGGPDPHHPSPDGDGSLTRYLDVLPTAVELRDGTGRRVHANPAALALDEVTPWGTVHLVDQAGTPLTVDELPAAACLAAGQPHRATIGVRPDPAADATAEDATSEDATTEDATTEDASTEDASADVLAYRWFEVHAAPARLPDGSRGVLVSSFEITTERHLEERLRQAELHDPLTGLPNRRLLAVRYSQAQASAARAGAHIGLVYLDLDRFKAINDVHGHGAGDRFLREFGTRLQEVTRAADTAARVGGDEFVVLCTHLDGARSLQTAASRIADAVDGTVVLDGRRATVGASVGWVLAGRDMDLDAALNQADTAMYRDKARRSAT